MKASSEMPNPRWGLVMTVREPAQLVLANVVYHLSSGASEVHVFLDDPADPVGPLLEQIEGCVVTLCDADHWDRVNGGKRPERQTRRQSLNATSVYRASGLDWLVHLDADEFLYQRRPLVEELAHTPRQPGYLAIETRERICRQGRAADDIFSGAFRVPFRGRDAFLPAIFGELSGFTTCGLAGHAAGKAAVPVGFEYRISIHAPRSGEGNRLPPLHATSTHLLHFDGLTPEHWLRKLNAYQAQGPKGLVGPHRLAQLEFMQEGCQTDQDRRDFHDLLKTVDADEEARLSALGLIEDLPFDIGPEAREAVARAGLSLTPDAFNSALAKK